MNVFKSALLGKVQVFPGVERREKQQFSPNGETISASTARLNNAKIPAHKETRYVRGGVAQFKA